MIIGEKNTDLKRLTGRLKLRFLTEIGRFQLKPRRKSRPLHLVWFSPEKYVDTKLLKNKLKKNTGKCISLKRNSAALILIFRK